MHCYSNFQVWLIFFLLIAKSKAIAIFVHDLNLQNFLYCRGYFTLRCLYYYVSLRHSLKHHDSFKRIE